MNLAALAESIHEATGETGDRLTQNTLVAAAALAYAFGKKEAGDHFAARALSYGPLVAGPQVGAPSSQWNQHPGWNFGGPLTGSVD